MLKYIGKLTIDLIHRNNLLLKTMAVFMTRRLKNVNFFEKPPQFKGCNFTIKFR